MEKFGWAYIGSGSIAKNTARNISSGEHRIVSVYSRNKEKAAKFAGKYGAVACGSFEEAVNAEGVEGVYIATPHTSHSDYSIRAMELGKPVLCEKPAGVSAEEVERIIRFAGENGIYFCEAMWTWFSDVAASVKKWIDGERIGEIRSVTMDYAFPGLMMSRDSRLLMPETAGGALLDVGIYPVTYCYRLFGMPRGVKCTGKLRDGIDIQETVILDYGTFSCTLNMSLSELKEKCIIEGTCGTVKVPMFHMARKAVLECGGNKEIYKGKTDYLTEFTAVAKEIRDGRKESAFIPFESTVNCMKILDECRTQLGLVYPFEK